MNMKKIKITNKHDFFKFLMGLKKQTFFKNFEFSSEITQVLLAEELMFRVSYSEKYLCEEEIQNIIAGKNRPYRLLQN